MEISDSIRTLPIKKKYFMLKDLGDADGKICITKGPTGLVATINEIEITNDGYVYINIK